MSTLRLIFLGPPGAGKGTQAELLSKEKSIAHISTGAMLRAAVAEGSDLGKQVKEVLDSGQLVSDDLMVNIIAERISREDCQQGYILDGFPRTLAQAESLAQMLQKRGEGVDAAVLFQVSEEDVLKRLSARQSAEQRSDDSPETQLERLRVYEKKTAPLVDYYREKGLLREVSASDGIEAVYGRLLESLSTITEE